MALNDEVRPYLICLDYVYTGGKMYFHFADYGRKMDLIRKDPNVSVELDSYNKGVTKYQNATFMGKLGLVTDAAEKKRAAAALVKAIRPPTGAKKVAARHGYPELDESLFASSGSILMRLDVEEYVALKSPDS
jgi:nitroimidazol reductase NimA-like FMN-containing flavoprotein (pyridoxamine 5'-phosphate oxidase superfamily)